ncbi:MAG: ROK family transcriptional regulator [Pseudomonadota bacterium]
MPSLPTDPASRTHNLVLAEVARAPGISRSDIAKQLGVNLATVSRASRDLIDCGLLQETGIKEAKGPGRPFIGLNLRHDGGYIIGIGVNNFRQSITLANLRNEKLAEWIAPQPNGANGAAFLERCIDEAAKLVEQARLPRDRFFGVGLAIAAEIDQARGVLTEAPTFGWTDPVDVRRMVADRLKAPLAIETPSLAITQAEAEFGIARNARNILTLHCSLGFGVGVRRTGDTGASVDFGRILTHAQSATPDPARLDKLCGGISVLNELEGAAQIDQLPSMARASLLTRSVARAETDPAVAKLLRNRGQLTGHYFSLLLDVLGPDLLLLAGPLAQAPDFAEGVTNALDQGLSSPPDIQTTAMTPTGASRWLALRANVLQGAIDFTALKNGRAA